MDSTQTKTLILREDRRLPNRYVLPSPTGKEVLVGTDPEGNEIKKPVTYRFSRGVPVQVHVDDLPIIKKMFRQKDDSIIPLFATSVEKAGKSVSPAQKIADARDDVNLIVAALAEQDIDLPQELLERVGLADANDDEGGRACSKCGNLHPGDYSGDCLRCGTEVV